MTLITSSTNLDCPPLYGTSRNEHRDTYGPMLYEVSQRLGTPFMPWQKYVSDVSMEINPHTGLLQYRTIVITVPRQSGKTTELLSMMVHRAIGFNAAQTIIYTAQTQKAARIKWEEEHLKALNNSSFRGNYSVKYGMGAEQIKWKNGSRHALTAPTEKAGHGEIIDLGALDEAFAQEDNRVEQALRPAMITRPQPQLVVVSTAGTARSTYLRGKVTNGRNRVEHEPIGNTFAYFEWSAPKDSDPGDPETWKLCMPALGHTISLEAVQSNYEDMELREFRRAFLNQWVDEIPNLWMVIGESDWENVIDTKSTIDPKSDIVFSADITPDRSFGCIGVAGNRTDGLLHVEIPRNSDQILDHRPGINWMVPRLKELADKWNPSAIVIQPNGPAGSLIPELEALKIPLLKPNSQEYAASCVRLYDAVYASPSELRHLNQASISVALSGAMKMTLGEGAWKWDRKSVSVDISPLVCISQAAWGLAVKSGKKASAPWVGTL